MDTQAHVKHWQEGALDAFDTAEKLMEAKKYNHALFFCHLALEKAVKALVIRQKGDHPFIHDLVRLSKDANVSLNSEQEDDFNEINTFNMRARYENIKFAFYKKATQEFSTLWFAKCKQYLDWLLNL